MQVAHFTGPADAAEAILHMPATAGRGYHAHGLFAVNSENTSSFGDVSATFTPIILANGTTAAVRVQHVGWGATPVALAGSGYPMELIFKPRRLEPCWYGLVSPKGLEMTINVIAAQPDAGTMYVTLWYDLI